jgi:hypothetical protein
MTKQHTDHSSDEVMRSLGWQGQDVALLTLHNKLPLIAPPLEQLGFKFVLTTDYDTDQLGTFAGDVPRELSPLECAKQKALLACELTGCRFGIGSEGSFGGGPLPGLLCWDDELLLLHDSHTGQDIVAIASGAVPLAPIRIEAETDLALQLAAFDTAQGWILKSTNFIKKGLVGLNAIQVAIDELDSSCKQDSAPVELLPDLRAMHCPVRQDYIRKAAEQLAQRLQSRCPQCTASDFWLKGAEYGLPCAACSFPTRERKALIKRCDCCGYREREAVESKFADPGRCDLCNP